MTETETEDLKQFHQIASELAAVAKRNGGKVARPAPEIEPPAALPADRAAAVEYGLTQFQQMAADRDALRTELAAARERIAALEIEAEGLRAQLNEALSRVTSATLVRDQAIADRIVYEALFISIQAQMRAFAVPAAPLVKDADNP